MSLKSYKKLLIVFLSVFLLIMIGYINEVINLPQNLMLIQGKEYTYNINIPFRLGITVEKEDVIKVNRSNNEKLDFPFKIQSLKAGKSKFNLKLFGKIPLKTVMVNVIPETYVVPCGNTIGVKINTRGILVVGVSSVKTSNGKNSKPCEKIEEGDIILTANGKYLQNVKGLSKIISDSNNIQIVFEIERNGDVKKISVSPVKDSENKNKIGLWVRDSTSGIGTLTFYDKKTSKFAALGHGITDIDTDSLLSVGDGDILESSVIDVDKGEKGKPGELKGIFLDEDFKLGEISENNSCGIYGKIVNKEKMPQNVEMPIALKEEVKVGPAIILSNINGTKVDSYTIDIQKIMKSNNNNTKSMVIKITDQRLKEMTGGIVQGMSGSPIIQNNKIVGAVTHVFINDPTRGYGVFAEYMLDKINNYQ